MVKREMCDFEEDFMAVSALNLLAFPDELLEMVLCNLPYDEISRLRIVCRKFDSCCQRLLNQGFIQVEKFHGQCLRDIKAQLPRRESERRDHPLARHSDILTAIETRLSLLSMTFMKYVDMNLCCFIPGRVIDEIFRVLRFVQCTATPPRSHEILQELRDISSMAMEHFDENIVPLLKQRIGVSTRSMSLSSPTSGMSVVSPSRSPSSTCLGGAMRRELAKMQLWVRHLTTTSNFIKKELMDYKEKMAEYKKKLQEQDKRILEQNQVITEQGARIAEQDGKISEMSRKVLEYDRRIVDISTDLGRCRVEDLQNANIIDKTPSADLSLTSDSSSKNALFRERKSSVELVEYGEMELESGRIYPEKEGRVAKTVEKRKLVEDNWNCGDCCKRQKDEPHDPL